MIIPYVYTSYLRRNKPSWRYFKLKKKHVDEPTFENSISSSGEEKASIPSGNDDTDSETEHDGEGLSFRDISNVVNQAVDVVKHPNKLIKQVVDIVKYPVNKLVNQVDQVMKHRLVPVKGAGLANEEDQMVYNYANSNDAEIDDNCMENTELEDMDGEIEDKWMEPDAKVSKLEDCEYFDDFQRADKHTPSRIPSTDKRKYAQRTCVGCRRNGIRRDTCHYCKDCSDNPALCKHCFDTYHM